MGRTAVSTTAIAAATIVTAPLAAQDTAAEPAAGESDEIVVTSLRRSETLQDTPAAVTAFDAQAIQNAGIERPADFIALTSNVTLVE
ncbi:MAG: TonB-dependent receptor, partial [Erythrobacter sp.]|nr:TonB-dependent receptor [Erythrobacter sp.]